MDWDDIPMRSVKSRVLRLIDEHHLGFRVKEVKYRMSANGGAHLFVTLRGKVSADYRMYVRAALADDIMRWCLNNQLMQSDGAQQDVSVGQLFNLKDGKEVGPWVRLKP